MQRVEVSQAASEGDFGTRKTLFLVKVESPSCINSREVDAGHKVDGEEGLAPTGAQLRDRKCSEVPRHEQGCGSFQK